MMKGRRVRFSGFCVDYAALYRFFRRPGEPDIGDETIAAPCESLNKARVAGIVTNVTNFGAFIDIGVHQDGLAHISQLSHKFVKDPREIVNPGDKVIAYILEVNPEKRQIALSLRGPVPVSAPVAVNERCAPPPAAKDNKRKDKPRPPQGFNNPFAKLGDWKK